MKLAEKCVFKSNDKHSDLTGQLLFVGKPPREPFGPHNTKKLVWYIMFEDGYGDWFAYEELNINTKSIRQYNPDTDPDFYGAHG